MYRRRILYSLGALTLPGFLAACGGGDDSTPVQPEPTPPDPTPIDPEPTPIDLAAGWTPGQVLTDASGQSRVLFSGTRLQPNGPGRISVVIGAHFDWRVFSLDAADGKPIAWPVPDFNVPGTAQGGVVNAIPNTRGGVLWLGFRGKHPAYRSLWTQADAPTGQPGPIQETLLDSGASPQATLLAQDQSGQSLLRWNRGPLPENEPPAMDELLMVSASAPGWTSVALPDPALSPDLLRASRTVFDQTGTAWMVQPSPGPTQDEWSLMLYSLAQGATKWSAAVSIPAESTRSNEFKMGIDARGRILVAHRSSSGGPSSPSLLSVSRFEPAQAAWTTLPKSGLSVRGFQLHVDAPGNIWVFWGGSYTRYDDKTGAWAGSSDYGSWTGPTGFEYLPEDAVGLFSDWEALPIATDSRGNAWVVGARRKSSRDQDLPALWINRFDASAGRWGKPATLSVTGGEDPIFVASSNQGQAEDSRFRVSMTMDSQERPVALINELASTGWVGFWSRAWVARGPRS